MCLRNTCVAPGDIIPQSRAPGNWFSDYICVDWRILATLSSAEQLPSTMTWLTHVLCEATGAGWRDLVVHCDHSKLQDAFECVSSAMYKDQCIESVARVTRAGVAVTSLWRWANPLTPLRLADIP